MSTGPTQMPRSAGKPAQNLRTSSPHYVAYALATALLTLSMLTRSSAHEGARTQGAPAGIDTRTGALAATEPAPAAAPGNPAESTVVESSADYTFEVRLDERTHTLYGRGRMALHNRTTHALASVWLHLYLNAFRDERSILAAELRAAGEPPIATPSTAAGALTIRALTIHGENVWPRAVLPVPEDATDVQVPLREPLLAGEQLSADVEFEAQLPALSLRTGYAGSFHFAGQWFPKFAKLEPDGSFAHFSFHQNAEFYANFGSYDVTLDVPEWMVVGATGQQLSEVRAGTRKVVRYTQNRVHDFAFTAWDKFQRREERIGDIAVTFLYPSGYDTAVNREVIALRSAIPLFSQWFGPYPYPTLTVVHPPAGAAQEAGGMEYPTLITTGGSWHGDGPVRLPEAVAVHEFAHQYFYGLVATNEARFPFLDEGLTSFAEHSALQHVYGNADLWQLGGLQVSSAGLQAASAGRGATSIAVAAAAEDFSTQSGYGTIVYARTQTILETLARVYGKPRLLAALGEYARRYRFAHPGPEQWLAVMGAFYPASTIADLRALLFERAQLDDAVSEFRSTRSGDGYVCTAKIRREGPLTLAEEVVFYTKNGARPAVLWQPGDDPGVSVRAPEPCAGVVLDPDRKLLLDTQRLNNASGTPGSSGRSFAVLDAAAAAAVAWALP